MIRLVIPLVTLVTFASAGCEPPEAHAPVDDEPLVSMETPLVAVVGPEELIWIPWGQSHVGPRPESGEEESLPSVPDIIATGEDGLVYVTVPARAEALVIDSGAGEVLGALSLPGPATDLVLGKDGTIAALIPSKGGIWARDVDGAWHALAAPSGAPSRLFWDDGLIAWSYLGVLQDLSSGTVTEDHGLPIAGRTLHTFARITGDGRAVVHILPWSVPAEPKRTDEGATVTLTMGTKHGAAHLVGSTPDGMVLFVLEEVESWPELEVARTAVWLSAAGDILAEVPLPPPSPYALRGEWAMAPGGALLLLRVDDTGVTLLSWRVQ